MPGAVIALNAGSSSVKFGLYEVDASGRPGLVLRGVLDLGDAPRLTAKAANGALLHDRLDLLEG